jgi:DNA-binding transcriptional regulator YiaG
MTVSNISALRDAIAASGLSARSFAALLEVDERTVRRWLSGDREIPGPVLVICRAILRDPGVVAALARATPPPSQ